jgi:hypothetical protein
MMFISKVNKGLSFNGNVVTMTVGQKTSNKDLVDAYPTFFEEIKETVAVVTPVIEEAEVAPVVTPVIEEAPVVEEKIDLSDEINALEDKVEITDVKETKAGFRLFGKKKK